MQENSSFFDGIYLFEDQGPIGLTITYFKPKLLYQNGDSFF